MKLEIVEPRFIDRAWKDGASCLSEACDESSGEITVEQLKMLLSRGERVLVRLVEDDKVTGWGVYRIDQLPNLRVLHITELVSHNNGFERFFDELKKVASVYGCSEIRCSCKPAQARLFARTNGFEPVYTTMRVVL